MNHSNILIELTVIKFFYNQYSIELDVYRKEWSQLKSAEQVETAVAELLTRNYVEIQPAHKPGRPEALH